MTSSGPQPELYCDQDMEQAVLHDVGLGTAAVFTRRSPVRETGNEDSAAFIRVDDQCVILAVADGVGGARSGGRASGLALQEFVDAVVNHANPGEQLRDAILNGVDRANAAVAALGIGAATTLAVASVEGRVARAYHVGDSEVLIVGQRGRIKLQTVSHSPVGYAVEAGFLDEKEALHHVDRHIILNSLGSPEMRIEISPAVELASYDTLLLGSDGLFDNLHQEEIIERVRKGRLKRAVAKLVTDSTQRMSEPREGQPSKNDDLTFIAFRLRARD